MPVITGALPIDEWTRYLEQGDEQLAGSGWGLLKCGALTTYQRHYSPNKLIGIYSTLGV